MKIYYIRNTHDEFNNYRGDSYFGIETYPDPKTSTQKEFDNITARNRYHSSFELPFGVHTWRGSGEKYKLTFDEIYQSTIDAYKDGAHDGRMMEMPTDYKHSVIGMMDSLVFMIAHKMVVTKIEI